MKFALPLARLTETVGIVSRAVAGKNIRPILANLLISVRGNEAQFVGTDMEIMMISRLPATVEVEGHFTIPARLLHEVVNGFVPSSDQDVVSFETIAPVEGLVAPTVVRLQTGRIHYDLQIQGIEDYPPVPSLEGETFPRFDIESAALKKGLREAAIAMATEEANPTQRSICMNFQGHGEIILVATDSKRLAVTAIPKVTHPPEFNGTYLVPARTVPELMKLLDESEKINVGLYHRQLVFTTKKFQLLSRLIDGKFPDYNRVLPKEYSRRLTVRRKDFLQAIRTVTPIARHSSQMVRLDIGPNEMRVWAESREEGLSESFVPVKLEGEPINIAFNGSYLSDFLNVLDEEETVMDMTTPSYPGVLKSGKGEGKFVYVLMPMSY
ncbi:MAG: DNA polymerase III beta subunit [Candidatus Ozemobacter sibiricus]|jgi:DNA polymerase-3 subunit beta|uniref:Beta sliding clamp n=1 Tax=Candidatus Ozemobacter sibiricus TaxID=2268124 RepID=A0A367ZL60_9BACT|nr:MAG: DNA polymerase III beta subunit [Candidatus Ozemobacter sibiricus]